MNYQIVDSPDFALLEVVLNQGETLVAESGAMVAMDSRINVETSMRGGLWGAAKRKLLGGESLFQNTYRADANSQRLYFAPAAEGDMRSKELARGEEFFLQSGSYVAHHGPELVIDTKFGGMRGFFSGVGLFLLRIVGPGTVFYGSYGALHEVTLDNGLGYTVDTGHIVGFTSGLSYQIGTFGGMKGLFFSGEGLIANFSGRGSLFVQTRNASNLAAFLHPFRPVQRRSGD